MHRVQSDGLEIERCKGSLKGWSGWNVPWEKVHVAEMRESQGQSLWNPSVNTSSEETLKEMSERWSENQKAMCRKARFKAKEWSGLKAKKRP